MNLQGGCEWVVEAYGCDPASLKDQRRLRDMFDAIITGMSLHPIADTAWHKFPGEGGVTGFAMLAESHIACHTFPEFGSLCLNLFCCRPRDEWQFAEYLKTAFSAGSVQIRRIDRPYHV